MCLPMYLDADQSQIVCITNITEISVNSHEVSVVIDLRFSEQNSFDAWMCRAFQRLLLTSTLNNLSSWSQKVFSFVCSLDNSAIIMCFWSRNKLIHAYMG
ncbi:hypothetical protein WUBG_18885 [Wuchereria bancrofti]|uniref:Uncharacterized protein n=1 Tax=Wuchereria bancrofti TaxID=6293 RepID=J9DZZ4_WUCBA|nr:hypothetical protein WUBG_18885 [Wuchereria bancrofti]